MAASASKNMGKDDEELEELLKGLDLHDAERDEVVLGKEEVANLKLEASKWMAIAKLHSTKKFSAQISNFNHVLCVERSEGGVHATAR